MPDIESTNNKSQIKHKKRRNGICQCCCPLKKSKAILNNTEQKIDEPDENTTEENIKQEEEQAYFETPVDRLTPGTCVNVHGFIKPECGRFAINFLCGKGNKADIAYHFNPRLAQRYIVRNSKIRGNWDTEETTLVARFEFERDQKFAVDFVCTDNEFFVAFNGKHICAYVYRVPLEKIKAIAVEGAVDVHGIDFKKVESYPPPSSFVPYEVPMGEGLKPDSDQKLEAPITARLPKGLRINWQLEICGRVKILPFAFYINLQQSDRIWPHPNIPLHLNARFFTFQGSHILIRNSWFDGAWGKEERATGSQFTPGSPFCLAIRKLNGYYSIWVDGALVGEFQFRSDKTVIDTLVINGDVTIKSIYVKTHIDDLYYTKKEVTDVADNL